MFLLCVPFWVWGALAEQTLQKRIPINLPVSALMAVNPLIAALILAYREYGSDGVR